MSKIMEIIYYKREPTASSPTLPPPHPLQKKTIQKKTETHKKNKDIKEQGGTEVIVKS